MCSATDQCRLPLPVSFVFFLIVCLKCISCHLTPVKCFGMNLLLELQKWFGCKVENGVMMQWHPVKPLEIIIIRLQCSKLSAEMIIGIAQACHA